MKNPIPQLLPISFVFISLLVLFSFLTSLFWRHSVVAVVLAVIGTIVLWKKYPVRIEGTAIVYGVALVSALLFIVPVISFSSGFPASGDALSTTILRVMGSQAPTTYAPYSDMHLTYPFGILYAAKAFADILPFADYMIIWGFVVFLGITQILLFYPFAHTLVGKKRAVLSTILFLGGRQLAYFVYWGLTPMLFAIDLFLLAFFLFSKKHRLYYLFLVTSFLNHPVGFGMIVTIIGVYAWRQKRLQEFCKPLVVLLVLVPLVLPLYGGTIINTAEAATKIIQPTPLILVSTALWAGPLTTILALLSLFVWIRKKSFSQDRFILFISIVFFVLYLVFYVNGSRFFDLVFIPATLFGALFASRFLLRLPEHKTILFHVILLILVVGSVLSSTQFGEIMRGTKISTEEILFAQELRAFDPELKKTLFVSPGEGWMAHISNKIPYERTSANLLPPFGVPLDEVEKLREQERIKKELLGGCADCVDGLDVEYIVINEQVSSLVLDREKLLEKNGFTLYRQR